MEKVIEIGRHKVTNASIENPIVKAMIGGDKIGILYSDLPWGDGSVKYWATLNRKQTGVEAKPLPYAMIVFQVRELIAQHVNGHVFIETGMRWVEWTMRTLMFNLKAARIYHLTYQSGGKMRPSALIHGVTDQSYGFHLDPTGLHGYEVVRRCVASTAVPGGILLDPCCGMGYSARAAVEAGMRFYGNEINAKRLQKTIDFLEAQHG